MVEFDLTKSFLLEDLFLQIKDKVEVNLLQLFICEINAELFNAVELHAFKSEYVEEADFKTVVLKLDESFFGGFSSEVHSFDKPIKTVIVDGFC